MSFLFCGASFCEYCSFEHDFVEVDNKDAEKEIPSVDVLPKFECSNITWNAKVNYTIISI